MSERSPRPVDRSPKDRPLPGGRVAVWRHPLWVRWTHWVNVAAVVVLVMSGLNILMAHPHLYWGVRSTFADPWLSFGAAPDWAMIPSGRDLAQGRRWHFFFAWVFVFNGLIYLILLIATRRLGRRLWPDRADRAGLWTSVKEHARFRFPKDDEARRYNVLQKTTYLALLVVTRRLGRRLWPDWTDRAGFWASVREHIRFRFPKDDEARRYNVIQKMTYLIMLFGILPMMLVTGLSMSPGFNSIGGLLLDLMGGRQSARTLHFLSAAAIVTFVVIHVGLVIWTGWINNMRAMITGWFVIEPSAKDEDGEDRP